jgi:hypothetical protein
MPAESVITAMPKKEYNNTVAISAASTAMPPESKHSRSHRHDYDSHVPAERSEQFIRQAPLPLCAWLPKVQWQWLAFWF